MSEWRIDNVAGRVWWNHVNDKVPRIWLERDGTFFFNLPDDENGQCPGQSYHDRFKDAAEAAIKSI